ncbi:MAG TPA: hypothetical protein VKQ72_09830, partial [Aggregatilineales bacterium]|nr:hypothetical protein [Aggregatilineales bacterium]
ADVNAARNVSWVAVNQPIVSDATKVRRSARGKPPAACPLGDSGPSLTEDRKAPRGESCYC